MHFSPMHPRMHFYMKISVAVGSPRVFCSFSMAFYEKAVHPFPCVAAKTYVLHCSASTVNGSAS